jgi:hypothetical protein
MSVSTVIPRKPAASQGSVPELTGSPHRLYGEPLPPPLPAPNVVVEFRRQRHRFPLLCLPLPFRTPVEHTTGYVDPSAPNSGLQRRAAHLVVGRSLGRSGGESG